MLCLLCAVNKGAVIVRLIRVVSVLVLLRAAVPYLSVPDMQQAALLKLMVPAIAMLTHNRYNWHATYEP